MYAKCNRYVSSPGGLLNLNSIKEKSYFRRLHISFKNKKKISSKNQRDLKFNFV